MSIDLTSLVNAVMNLGMTMVMMIMAFNIVGGMIKLASATF